MGGVSALMSIGLFSTRGTAAARPVYEITSPVFDEVSIRLDKRYYPADRSDRFVKGVRVLTFKDVNVEELTTRELELPKELALDE